MDKIKVGDRFVVAKSRDGFYYESWGDIIITEVSNVVRYRYELMGNSAYHKSITTFEEHILDRSLIRRKRIPVNFKHLLEKGN